MTGAGEPVKRVGVPARQAAREPFDADRIARLGNDPQRVYSAHGFQLPGGAVGVAFVAVNAMIQHANIRGQGYYH